MQISFKERAGHMLVFIDGPLYQRGSCMLVFKMVSFIREAAAMLGKMQISFKERAGCIPVFKMVPYIREVAAMLGKMQISFKERAGHILVLLGFELSSVIVDSLGFKRGSEVESDSEESSRIACRLLYTKSKLKKYATTVIVYIG